MAIPVEEAIAALSTFSLEDEQPDVQGLAVLLSSERYATNSPIEYSDVAAYRLSLGEDTKAINQLNSLIQEGKEMASLLYTYRSCVKALPQLPDSMKHSQADLYLETYQVLDLEMSRLREIQRWQASAASKLAADMQRFSRPERLVNGPTITHFWSMLKLLDVLLQLDHLKNAKASIPNDFSWYKRTFTQVSSQWQDTDTMREELDDLQIHCLQFLICELVSGGNMRKPGGLFGNSGSGIPVEDLKQLETFFYKLSFFLHILDYTATIGTLTDLGFLWFREFYLESSRVIQFPIECSLPWMLVDHVIESQDAGLLESILIPFDLYNDSAQHALTCLKQRFLYDEIEAEVDLCFDLLAQKLNEIIFTYYKSCAASTLLDSTFTYACDDGEKYFVKPLRFDAIFKLRRVMVLGRTIDLRSLITQRMNKIFRGNIDFLLERFENGDLCGVVELQQLLDILELTHQSISKFLELDSYSLMLSEMQENLSLVSYSSRFSSQIWSEMQTDFLPNFILCNTTQRFVRSIKGTHHSSQRSSASSGKPYFYCGSHDLTMAYQGLAGLYRDFFGVPHMFAVVKLLGSRSLPAIIRALLDHISSKITGMVPKITALQEALPKSIGLLSFDGGIAGCQKIIHEILTWEAKSEVKTEVLHDLKEIGSALYWMSILDIVLRQIDTTQFMQSAPWLGLVPGNDGQVKHAYSDSTPFTTLLSAATNAVTSSPACPNPSTFLVMSKQAEAASLLYKSNLNSGSVLEYALAFTSAALDRHYSKWSATPKTGFIDITTSKDFYRIFSGLQYSYLEESISNPSKKQEMLGDSVAWAGCTIMYLLGQQQHFELFDFSYQFLNVAEVESATVSHYQSSERTKSPNFLQGYEGILEAMRKARRLNNHVFSMLRARCPLEDKVACAIKPSGAPLHRMKFMNTVSAFETLPQRAT
ncbi:hypothetical protein PVAP13_9NG752877 [Panicum virgatum]|uniref:CYRIA/CYRIB Rac1 binding domain-containing protein n=1 Tax=Panicum virgatum TaxID=38727 RepID=A0A8T0N405_PANVG|nr:hypothetical protein PVAP13_9NG752877 [Panicum virgatum]